MNPGSIKVKLTPEEDKKGAAVGLARHKKCRSEKVPNKHNDPGSIERQKHIDIQGATGELAVAKGLHKSWNGNITKDVGGYQVRSVDSMYKSLMIRPDDITEHGEDAVFILVVKSDPINHPLDWSIEGWMRASEARDYINPKTGKNDWWGDKGNGQEKIWFVPRDKIHSMESLPADVDATMTQGA